MSHYHCDKITIVITVARLDHVHTATKDHDKFPCPISPLLTKQIARI